MTAAPRASDQRSGAKAARQGAPVLVDGRRVWQTLRDIELDAEVFDELGAAFEAVFPVSHGLVGSAPSRLFRQRPAVDFAAQWIAARRQAAPQPA